MKYTHIFKCHLVFKCITLIYLFVLESRHWDTNIIEKAIANRMNYCKYHLSLLSILNLNLEPFKVVRLSGNTAQLKLIAYKCLFCKYVSGIIKHSQGLVMSEVRNSIFIGVLAGGPHKSSCFYLQQPVIYWHRQHFARISKLEKKQPFVRRNCNGIMLWVALQGSDTINHSTSKAEKNKTWKSFCWELAPVKMSKCMASLSLSVAVLYLCLVPCLKALSWTLMTVSWINRQNKRA